VHVHVARELDHVSRLKSDPDLGRVVHEDVEESSHECLYTEGESGISMLHSIIPPPEDTKKRS
jgi:hypothetical protein